MIFRIYNTGFFPTLPAGVLPAFTAGFLTATAFRTGNCGEHWIGRYQQRVGFHAHKTLKYCRGHKSYFHSL